MNMRHLPFLLVLAMIVNCLCESVLVSIQSQTQEDMDAMTAKIDEQAQGYGPARLTLGAIEATMSRVVDVEDPYLVTVPQSVPTLTLLDDVSFDPQLQLWKMRYETMRVDPSAQINDYKRVLYFTKKNEFVVGDTRNPCLTAGANDVDCLVELGASYAVLGDEVPEPSRDYLTYDGGVTATCSDVCLITSTLTDEPLSAKQILEITIPHSVVRGNLAIRTEENSPETGVRTQYSFGVGIVFVSSGNNMIIFDSFDVIENSHDQMAISKLNSYAVAKHVSFYTEVAYNDPFLRIATVEYLLDKGQRLDLISASLGGRPLNETDCALMQARIDSLADSQCITPHKLCMPIIYSTGSGATLQTWASYVLPLPQWHTSPVFKINTLLTTHDNVTDTKILSTLNFETRSPPQPACENAFPVAFNPMQYVVAELFRGHELKVEQIQGQFSIKNETAFSMAESLMTVVLRPADTDSAIAYFERYTDESIALDQLYMSHAIEATVLPDHVLNEAIGVENGRSEITLDPVLQGACPAESVALYTSLNMECVTTHDWGLTGAIARPVSTNPSAQCSDCHFFVREVGQDVNGDLTWLRSNIFGSSDPGVTEAFYTQVRGLVPSSPRNLNIHSKTYWVWPLYHWPGRAPVGLKDKTIVSLSWSIVKTHTRRLLSYEGAFRHLLSLDAVENMYKAPDALRDSGTDRRKTRARLMRKRRSLNAPGREAPEAKASKREAIKAIKEMQASRERGDVLKTQRRSPLNRRYPPFNFKTAPANAVKHKHPLPAPTQSSEEPIKYPPEPRFTQFKNTWN